MIYLDFNQDGFISFLDLFRLIHSFATSHHYYKKNDIFSGSHQFIIFSAATVFRSHLTIILIKTS